MAGTCHYYAIPATYDADDLASIRPQGREPRP